MRKYVKDINSLGMYTAAFEGSDFAWAISQGFVETNVEIGLDGNYYAIGRAPEPPTLQEMAWEMSMPKNDFINMVEALTTAFNKVDSSSEIITFAKMWEWCATDMNLLKLFIAEPTVYRKDPIFEATTTQFAGQFLQYLDMMFVYQDVIMQRVKEAQANGTIINLDDLLPQV